MGVLFQAACGAIGGWIHEGFKAGCLRFEDDSYLSLGEFVEPLNAAATVTWSAPKLGYDYHLFTDMLVGYYRQKENSKQVEFVTGHAEILHLAHLCAIRIAWPMAQIIPKKERAEEIANKLEEPWLSLFRGFSPEGSRRE